MHLLVYIYARIPQQIKVVGKLEEDNCATMFLLLKSNKILL